MHFVDVAAVAFYFHLVILGSGSPHHLSTLAFTIAIADSSSPINILSAALAQLCLRLNLPEVEIRLRSRDYECLASDGGSLHSVLSELLVLRLGVIAFLLVEKLETPVN